MNAPNALMGRFDQDPGQWRPMFYAIRIEVPNVIDRSEEGSITINNQPYIWKLLTHQIVGNTGDPEASGLYQDGQYDIEFRDEQSNYGNAPLPADASFGSVRSGYVIPFQYPISFAGAKTLTFRITNRVTRILSPTPAEDTFKVAIVMHGIADWGQLTTNR
jgi:hypothetical protein